MGGDTSSTDKSGSDRDSENILQFSPGTCYEASAEVTVIHKGTGEGAEDEEDTCESSHGLQG